MPNVTTKTIKTMEIVTTKTIKTMEIAVLLDAIEP
jgi:hypothetical protein